MSTLGPKSNSNKQQHCVYMVIPRPFKAISTKSSSPSMATMPPTSTSNLRFSFLFLLLLSLISSTVATSTNTTDDSPTTLNAYQVLQTYNFPIGILPEGCQGYDLDNSTGKFSAYLTGTCEFSLAGSYQLKYGSTISGYISTNRLSSLQGVSVKILFFWINIVEVTRVGDELNFSVGILSASFPISNFFECPKCGCGVDCINALEKRDGLKLRSDF